MIKIFTLGPSKSIMACIMASFSPLTEVSGLCLFEKMIALIASATAKNQSV